MNFAKSIRTSLLLLLLAGPALAGSTMESPLPFRTGLVAAARAAFADGKPLVVYFYEDRSVDCEHFERDALASRGLADLADRAVFVRQNAERDDGYGDVARLLGDFDIDRFPTVVVLKLSKHGKPSEMGRIVGPVSGATFSRRLHGIVEGVAPHDKAATRSPGGGAADARVRRLLAGAGYTIEKKHRSAGGREIYQVRVARSGWKFVFQFGLSDNGNVLWVWVNLVDTAKFEKAAGRDALARLLRANDSIGRARFELTKDFLALAESMDVENMTSKRISAAVDSLISVTISERSAWDLAEKK